MGAMGRFREAREALERAVREDPQHPGALVDLAGLRFAEGRYEEALELAQRAMRVSPGVKGAAETAARALASLGRYDEAGQIWERILKQGPSPEAARGAASFFAAVGETDRATEVLEEATSKFPEGAGLWLALADLQWVQGVRDEAKVSLTKAQTVAPEDPEVVLATASFQIRGGDPNGGFRLLREAYETMRKGGRIDDAARLAAGWGRLLLRAGAVAGAQEVLEEAYGDLRQRPEVGKALAFASLIRGDLATARRTIESLREQSPTDRGVRQMEAYLYLLDGRPNWALDLLGGLVARGDATVLTHFLYAKALAREGRLARARREYEAILRRVPRHVLARFDYAIVLFRLREYDAAQKALDALPEPFRTRPEAQLLAIRIQMGRGAYRSARKRLGKLLREEPENDVLLTLRGEVEELAGRPQKALPWYRKARAHRPSVIEPLLAETRALEALGRLGEARRVLEDYLKTQGERPEVLNRLAEVHLAAGRLTEALHAANRSLLIEPNFWASREVRAQAFLAEGDISKAILELEEAIRLNPYWPPAYNRLAGIYLQQGEWDKAEKTYRRLLGLVPEEPLTANNLAALLLKRGDPEAALPLARIAVAGAPRSAATLDTLGWTLERLGKSKEAQEFLVRAKSTLPQNGEVLYHWAVNQRSLGKGSKAREEVRRFLGSHPRDPSKGVLQKFLKEKNEPSVSTDSGRSG